MYHEPQHQQSEELLYCHQPPPPPYRLHQLERHAFGSMEGHWQGVLSTFDSPRCDSPNSIASFLAASSRTGSSDSLASLGAPIEVGEPRYEAHSAFADYMASGKAGTGWQAARGGDSVKLTNWFT